MPARVPRMATGDAQQREPRAVHGPVALDRFAGVGRTGRLETAATRQPRTDRQSIERNQPEQDRRGDQPPTDKTAISTLPPPPDFCSPSCAFRGWKQISLGGRKLSKSYGDLRKLGSQADWVWDTPETKPLVKDIDMPMPDAPKSVSAITFPLSGPGNQASKIAGT